MEGGENGNRGLNLLTSQTGKTVSLGGKNTVNVLKGDRLTIFSPGGGGWGIADSNTATFHSARMPLTKFGGGSLKTWAGNQETA
jgi:N-methylhydantoinase B/oxoprolinase/acetone carboxylase alpha subunit